MKKKDRFVLVHFLKRTIFASKSMETSFSLLFFLFLSYFLFVWKQNVWLVKQKSDGSRKVRVKSKKKKKKKDVNNLWKRNSHKERRKNDRGLMQSMGVYMNERLKEIKKKRKKMLFYVLNLKPVFQQSMCYWRTRNSMGISFWRNVTFFFCINKTKKRTWSDFNFHQLRFFIFFCLKVNKNR